MKRTMLFLVVLGLGACDSEPEDAAELRAETVEAEEGAEVEGERGRRHHGHMRGRVAEHVCEAVACSDEQQAQVRAAFAPPERGDHPERPDMSEANQVLAQAFAGEGFGVDDLATWRAALPDERPRRDHHLETLSELHTILSADQRATLAAKFEAGELMGKKRHHRGRRGEGADKEKGHRVERFCEAVECSEAQRVSLEALAEQHRAERPDPQARRAAVAQAFASDSFDLEQLQDQHGKRVDAMQSWIVDVHGLLTPAQREAISERIAEHGPRAVMGKRGRHGKRGRRHHRGSRDFG